MPQVSAQWAAMGTGRWGTLVKLSAEGKWTSEGLTKGAAMTEEPSRATAPCRAVRARLRVPALNSSSHPPYESALSSQPFHKEFRDSHTCEKCALERSQVPVKNIIPEVLHLSFNFLSDIIEKPRCHRQRVL